MSVFERYILERGCQGLRGSTGYDLGILHISTGLDWGHIIFLFISKDGLTSFLEREELYISIFFHLVG